MELQRSIQELNCSLTGTSERRPELNVQIAELIVTLAETHVQLTELHG